MLFGLACEGVTDQITIENILCGYFENPDLDEEIQKLQPPFDETNQKQKDFGNWLRLFDYLASTRFRDDVLNTEILIIQVDTDDCDKAHFNVSKVDSNNNELETEVLIELVIEKLISVIENGKAGFYQAHAEKIIFSISVHMLECWIYAHYNQKPLKKPKTKGCFKALEYVLPETEKTYQCYKELTKPFLKRKNIDVVAQKDSSFRIFIESLQKIELP